MPSAEFWKALPALNGPQLVVALVVVALVLGFFGARYFFTSGKDRLVVAQEDRTTSIGILKSQVGELTGKVSVLESEVKRLNENEGINREYRHALANRANAFQFNYNSLFDLLHHIMEQWVDAPDILQRQVAHIRSTQELIAEFPLPE